MDIPVTGSWVGHLDGVDNASIVPRLRATFKRRITPMALL